MLLSVQASQMTLHPFREWRLSQTPKKTLMECAPQLGVAYQHLGAVECRTRTPSVDLIVKMAALTNGKVSQEEILRFATRQAA